MRSKKPRVAAWVLVMLLAACTTWAGEAVDAFAQVQRMGRGVNIIGYDPIWDDLEKARFQKKHFEVIRQGGFQTVRINWPVLAPQATRDRLCR